MTWRESPFSDLLNFFILLFVLFDGEELCCADRGEHDEEWR